MIPFKDDNPTRHFPVVTISLIAANITIYILQMMSLSDPGKVALAYGVVPHFLLTFKTVQPVQALRHTSNN